MRFKPHIKRLIEKLVGGHIYADWQIPRGFDLYRDISRDLKSARVKTVFDIGANIGQSAMDFLRGFPESRVYCFEPARETYKELVVALKSHPRRTQAFCIALGAREGRALLLHDGISTTFRLMAAAEPHASHDVEEVEISTIDAFCQANHIGGIDYLKIDTEGSDLHVLEGAGAMLAEQSIGLIQVEAGMNRRNRLHVPLESFQSFLEPKGYFLFGLYEQWPETPTKRPNLRRTNAVFVSERIVEAHST